MKKQKLLFLSHRFPYPPDKGDKIRALNILEHLAARYEVWLGCLDGDAEGAANPRWAEERGYHIYCGLLGRMRRLVQTGWSMINGQPLSTGYFYHDGLQRWVTDVLANERPDLIYVYSSAMAQYVMKAPRRSESLIMDFVDVDSLKWEQYATSKPWPVAWMYRLEAGRLLHHDRQVASLTDASLFVSAAEARIFKDLAPEVTDKTFAVSNGVDTTHFSPDAGTPAPALTGKRTLVFVGVMDYWPNVEAVQWFADHVFPEIRKQIPDIWFQIVGSRPSAAVQALGTRPNIEVTGAVPDVRPYLSNASVVVTPLRIARGIQNKVLEGMAMAKPLVTTPDALEGISAVPGEHVLVASTPEDFAAKVLMCLNGHTPDGLAKRARDFVVAKYSWQAQLADLDRVLERLKPTRPA